MDREGQILEAIQTTNVELVKIGGAVDQSAKGISELLRRGQMTQTVTGRNGIMPTLVAVAAIMFGLMTPLYILVAAARESITNHSGQFAHPEAQAAMAQTSERLRQKLAEVETQFRGAADLNAAERRHHDFRLQQLESRE